MTAKELLEVVMVLPDCTGRNWERDWVRAFLTETNKRALREDHRLNVAQGSLSDRFWVWTESEASGLKVDAATGWSKLQDHGISGVDLDKKCPRLKAFQKTLRGEEWGRRMLDELRPYLQEPLRYALDDRKLEARIAALLKKKKR